MAALPVRYCSVHIFFPITIYIILIELYSMEVLDQEKVDRIRQVLKKWPGGITITGLASEMKVNRNILAKYLDLLVLSGQVEKQTVGTAKMYHLSHNIPVSSLPDYFSDCVVMLDRDGRIMKVNERAFRFMSVPRENVIGARIGETKDPFLDSIPSGGTGEEEGAMPGKEGEFSCTVRGIRYTFLLRTVPTVHEKGNRGNTLILEDITAERNYQDIVEENESDYLYIVNDLPDLVIKFTPDGTLSFANAAVCRMVRRGPEELTGRSIMPLVPEDDKPALERCLAALSRSSPTGTVVLRLIDPAGSARWFDWTVRAVFDRDGVLGGYQAAGTDITEKREIAGQNSRYAEDMKFLHRKAWEFCELPPDADIYERIGRGVRELVPGSIVLVNEFTPAIATTRSFIGDEEHAVFIRHSGRNWIGKGIRPSENLKQLAMGHFRSGSLVKIPGNLYVACHKNFPEDVCRKIEDELHITGIWAIGLVHNGNPLANVIIMLRDGNTIRDPDLVETFIRLSAIALLCIRGGRVQDTLSAG